jgi:hypothetical protein
MLAAADFQTTAAQSGQRSVAGPLKTVYIVPTSHYDLGFVEPPSEVKERAARHLNEVLRLAESVPDFRWTIESVWQVQAWLERTKPPTSVLPRDTNQIERLMRLIRERRVALSASWGSMHTDFMGIEVLNRLAYGFSALHRRYGIDTSFAMLDDVPGHPASVASVLAGSGVERLIVGANQGLMGGTTLAPGQVPFYWEGPDGARVLTWISQGVRGGYVEGLTDFFVNPFTLDPYTAKPPYLMFHPDAAPRTPLQVMEEGVQTLQKYYRDAGYPFDLALVMHAHDFLDPSSVLDLHKAVDLWNASFASPVLRIATPPEFFDDMERRHANDLPHYRGGWSGLWSEAKTQSPQISALARSAHDITPAAETIWSAIAASDGIPPPTGSLERLYDLLFEYDEHSGAGNTGWPGLNTEEGLAEQNRQYAASMTRASSDGPRLLRTAIELLTEPAVDAAPGLAAGRRALVVYNPLSWKRTDVVRVRLDSGVHVTGIRNGAGEDVPFDVDIDGTTMFVASDVPSVGYLTFDVRIAPGEPVTTMRREAAAGPVRLGRFMLTADANGRIVSVRDATLGELVNQQSAVAFNELVRTRGDVRVPLVGGFAPRLHVERGRVAARVVLERPSSALALVTATAYHQIQRLEWQNVIDTTRLPFVRAVGTWHDSYSFALPFAGDPAIADIRAEGQRGWSHLPGDWLPGARRDAVATQHAIAVTTGGRSITIAHRQAFFFLFGGFMRLEPAPPPAGALPAMLTGSWPLAELTLFSRAFRRGTQADTSDRGVIAVDSVEPGLGDRYVFDYALTCDRTFDEADGTRFGTEFNVPLQAVVLAHVPARPTQSLFTVDAPSIRLLTFKVAEQNPRADSVTASPLVPRPPREFVLRLQETAGRAADVTVTLPFRPARAERRNLVEGPPIEHVAPGQQVRLQVRPYEVVTLWLTRD